MNFALNGSQPSIHEQRVGLFKIEFAQGIANGGKLPSNADSVR
jgi:hypothetical protein